jgi:NAD(P)H-dependent FMN reductase
MATGGETNMTIVTIQGSPRRNGNTATVLSAFESLAAVSAAVERIDVVDKKISGCLGCDKCKQRSTQPGCVQRDDVMEILDRIIASDLVVYAGPVYVWDFPARMKALMERHYCLVKGASEDQDIHLLEEKRTALLMTCGGSAEENGDLLADIFRREMAYLHCRPVGEYIVPLCTKASELGNRSNEVAQQMAADLLST